MVGGEALSGRRGVSGSAGEGLAPTGPSGHQSHQPAMPASRAPDSCASPRPCLRELPRTT